MIRRTFLKNLSLLPILVCVKTSPQSKPKYNKKEVLLKQNEIKKSTIGPTSYYKTLSEWEADLDNPNIYNADDESIAIFEKELAEFRNKVIDNMNKKLAREIYYANVK